MGDNIKLEKAIEKKIQLEYFVPICGPERNCGNKYPAHIFHGYIIHTVVCFVSICLRLQVHPFNWCLLSVYMGARVGSYYARLFLRV